MFLAIISLQHYRNVSYLCTSANQCGDKLPSSKASLHMHLSSTNLHLLQRRKKQQLNIAVCGGDRSRQGLQSL